jgi:hypothetical protein
LKGLFVDWAKVTFAMRLRFWPIFVAFLLVFAAFYWFATDHFLFLNLRPFREQASQADFAYFGERNGMHFGISVLQRPEKLMPLRSQFSDLFSGATEIRELTTELNQDSLQREFENSRKTEELAVLKFNWSKNFKQSLEAIFASGYLDIHAALATRRIWQRLEISNAFVSLLSSKVFSLSGAAPFQYKWVNANQVHVTLTGSDLRRILAGICAKELAVQLCEENLPSIENWIEENIEGGLAEFESWSFLFPLFTENSDNFLQISNTDMPPNRRGEPKDQSRSSPSLRTIRMEKMIKDCESIFGQKSYGSLLLRHSMIQNHLLQLASSLIDEDADDELSDFWQSPLGSEKFHHWEDTLTEMTSWSTSSLWGWSNSDERWAVRTDFENPDLSPGDPNEKIKPREHFVSLVEGLFPLQSLTEDGYLVKWIDDTVVRVEGFFEEVEDEAPEY